MKRLSMIKRLCLCIMTSFAFAQPVYTRTTDDLNQMMVDRYDIVHYIEVECELSFYSTLNCENGFGSIDALGLPLKFGTIAACRSIPFYTQFSFAHFGHNVKFTKTDVGSPRYIKIENGIYYIDILIERPYGYSDKQYYNYVNSLGRVRTKGRMYFE